MAQKIPAHILPLCIFNAFLHMAGSQLQIRCWIRWKSLASINSCKLPMAIHLALEGLHCFYFCRWLPCCNGHYVESLIWRGYTDRWRSLFHRRSIQNNAWDLYRQLLHILSVRRYAISDRAPLVPHDASILLPKTASACLSIRQEE